MKNPPTTIETYIKSFPPEVRKVLEQYYAIFKELAPEAVECISYGMPCFKLNGKPLGYFGGFKKHTSLFPGGGKVVELYEDELKDYVTSKGTIQFQLGKPLPLALLTKIIKGRIKENKMNNKQQSLRK